MGYTLEQLQEQMKLRQEMHLMFIKQVLLLSSGLFGILVSLHRVPQPGNMSIAHIAWLGIIYSASLVALSLGILALAIALYKFVALHQSLQREMVKEMLEELNNINYRAKSLNSSVSKIYTRCEQFAYVSLAVSVICLTFYSVFSNF